jgi:ABC-type transport system substrate-binding protein
VIGLLAGEIHFSDIGTEVVPQIEEGEGVGILNQHQYQAATDLIRLGGLNKLDPEGGQYDPTNPWTDTTPVGETTAGALVRQAMNYAIDKTAIIDSIYEGVGGVAPVPIGVAKWLADLDPYSYNPSMAIDLLEQAGYGDGFEVTLLEDGRYSHALNALAVADYWEDIGLTVTIETHTWPDIRGRWATGDLSHGYAWCHRTPPAAVDPLMAINMAFNPGGVLADYSDDFGEYVNAMATQVYLVNIFTPVAVSDLLDEPRDMYDLNEHAEYISRK